jgi:hypothetical protein
MRTDARGREVAPAPTKRYSAAALLQPFLTGAMIGVGFCLVMGPGLPVLGWGVSAASKAAAPVVAHLSQDWPGWRDRVLGWTIARAVAAERRDDEELLHRKWRLLQESLSSTWKRGPTSR